MKKSILTLLVLFSFQIATSQEKEEQKQKEQKVIREENGSVVLKSYQNVTVDTKKEEKKKEEKTSSETPFGIPLEVKVTLPDSLILTEKPFYLRTLKKEYSKEYFKEGSPLQIFSNSRNKNPEHFLEKDETQLSFEKNKDKSFSVYVPSLRANKLYFLETKTISEIVKVFILIKQEGAPNYECPKKWMVLLKRLNDKILAKPEKFNGQSIYFFPTKKELEEFRAKLKSENLTKENLFDQPEDAIIELAIETFPILNCSNPKLDCPDFSKSKILRFIEWVLDPKKQEFTNDDTWVFGDFGQEAYGIGLYLDYENVYEFYEKHLSSKLEVLDNNRGDEITMIVEREFEKQIKRYNELNEIPPNYPFIKPGTNDEINPNLFKDFSTYPAKFETSFINSITLDFGLSTFFTRSHRRYGL
ncbi:hypothetical protein ACFSQJ_18785 [Croceitalea marina]|uniref:Uncharacterized protein n=1 Tax=Croceitalea marina TaxID=1775166 RepID=A0ABW5N313_9FLAO